MLTETIQIKVDGSMPYARLNTFIWEESPEIKKKKKTTDTYVSGWCI